MKNTIVVKGVECKMERVDIYLKKGPYTHEYNKGWQAVDMEGDIVIDGAPSHIQSAYEYQQVNFKTRKALIEDIEYDNKEWEERKRRRAEK